MFERFTEPARQVIVLAQEEATRLGHGYIGTEHILLGLLRQAGIAGQALESLGFTIDVVRERVEQTAGRGKQPSSGHIPFTPRAKVVLELSLREAMQLDHADIGTEHILLGLIREGNGMAAQIMTELAGDLDRVRERVEELLPQPAPGRQLPGAAEPVVPARAWRRDLREAISSMESRLDAIERHLGLRETKEPPGAGSS
jgi:ATP-dependent Clp protease ATP-binding subunit ClpC